MEKPKPSFENALAAFFLAITAAALAFPLVERLGKALFILWRSGFDISRVLDSLLPRMPYSPAYLLAEIIVAWMVSVILAILPYAIWIAVARQLKLFHWHYFSACGAFMAVFVTGMLALLMSSWGHSSDSGQWFAKVWFDLLPPALVCGLVAGGVCGLYLRYRILDER